MFIGPAGWEPIIQYGIIALAMMGIIGLIVKNQEED